MSKSKTETKEIKPYLLDAPEQTQARNKLVSLMNTDYQPYTGQRFASFPLQDVLQNSLTSYANRGNNQLTDAAGGELFKTLTGGYDPSTSEYYKATRNAMRSQVNEGLNQLKRNAQLGGMLYSTPTQDAEAKYLSNATNNLNGILGQLALTERQNRLNAVPAAMQVGNYQANQPLQTANAIGQYGSLLQSINQQPLDWQYQQYQDAMNYPYQYQLPIAQALANPSMYDWQYPVYQTTTKNGNGGILGQALGMGAAVGLAPFTGGASLAYLPAAMSVGGGIGDMISGNSASTGLSGSNISQLGSILNTGNWNKWFGGSYSFLP